MHLIAAGGYVGYGDYPPAIRDSIIGSLKSHHHGAHFPVNIAKDVANTWAIEDHSTGTTRFVQPQVKSLALEKREHVVEKRIVVRKLHWRSNLYYENMR